MQIAVVGIKGDLSLREKVSKGLLTILKKLSIHMSIVPLVTCNRFEIYFTCVDINKGFDYLFRIIKQHKLESYFYGYFGKDCFIHLCKTAAGLDSAIVGESEIQRQVKKAYGQYSEKKLPFSLHYLFQKSLMISKQIRTQFFLESPSYGLEKVLMASIKKHFRSPKILFIGNSAINRKIFKYFEKYRNISCVLSSRFGPNPDLEYLSWDLLHRWVEFDVIICGSKYQGFCIHPRKTAKQIHVFDLSVPRCINPEIANDKNIFLKNIDEIFACFQSERGVFSEKWMNFIDAKVERLIRGFEKKERAKLFFQKAAS